jgi:hypothetical protein
MRVISIAWGGMLLAASCSTYAEYPIAGLNPSQRPVGAPVIEWVNHDNNWYQHALTGVHQPYPRSLYFLENQGDWHTPFNQPGMQGRYDIRGWHQK